MRISGFWLRVAVPDSGTYEQRGPGVGFIGVIIAFFTVVERLLAASANMRVYFLDTERYRGIVWMRG